MLPKEILELKRIGKCFGSNRVLEGVSFDLREGEVHALAGENGAGKSTLIKILAGIHTEYEGDVELQGKPVRFSNPHDAGRRGISVIHQEMSLVDSMSVADNIHLGRESSRLGGWWLDRPAQLGKSLDVCRRLGLDLSEADLDRPVEQFALSAKNQIEIAKALAFEARILVMDEPTGALNRAEVERLFGLMEVAKGRGCGIIFITHRMEEIYRVADRITVLRDGRLVGTARAKECPEPRLIQWMVGREIAPPSPVRPGPATGGPGQAVLEIDRLAVPDPRPGRFPAVRDFSIRLHAGEIVGIAGLQGSGGTELFQGLFGALGPVCDGRVLIDGKAFRPECPSASIRRGLAYLTGDRKRSGLVLGLSVENNVTLAALPRLSPGGVLQPSRERRLAARQVETLRIRLASLEQPVGTLSGGNQQKVVLAKWLETHPKVLLLEEPTRGVDVASKMEFYSLMEQWTAQGLAILLITTELPELLRLSGRILALHRGRVTAEFSRATATPENVMAAAMGGSTGLTPGGGAA